MNSSSGGYPPGAENDPRAPYNEKPKEKIKVKAFVSVTYSKVIEVEVEEGYNEVDLKDAVQESGFLPNDVLKDKYWSLVRYIASNDWVVNGEHLIDLLMEKQRYSQWHEDELEVIEEK